ncbi:FkbM family methyltransferase [Emticicia sp. BO119]|uniref:FkbM family methyltransferase n=1 Tax=Emticicia sp. BO119 TaxID=2757768 RepID=UPI0015F10980|nr:FkbM family methyltransferase [Emticicia sp. BO119]MBA4854078.1 FkbM family methyltransferase [Emticicia sp. BO119]
MNIFIELWRAVLKSLQLPLSVSQKFQLIFVLTKLAFLKIVAKNQTPARVKIFGFEIVNYNYRLLDYLIKEVFVGYEYKFSAKTSAPVIFDCGANIGMATIFFKWLYPEAIIYAFEPQTKTFEFLQQNIKNNNLSNVHSFNLALSDEEGTISFYESDSQNLMGSILEDRVVGMKIEVQTKRLSDFITQKIDLMKIDVEGAENLIIKDLVENRLLNKEKVDQIIMEYHHKIPKQKSSMGAFLKPFEDNNFEYQIRTDFHQLDTFQDMLIHFF